MSAPWRFEKPCARQSCTGVVRRYWRFAFLHAKFCSNRCTALVNGRRNARAQRAMPTNLRDPEEAYRRGYRRGYGAGWFAADKRWRTWLARHPVNTWFGGAVKGPLRGAA